MIFDKDAICALVDTISKFYAERVLEMVEYELVRTDGIKRGVLNGSGSF